MNGLNTIYQYLKNLENTGFFIFHFNGENADSQMIWLLNTV